MQWNTNDPGKDTVQFVERCLPHLIKAGPLAARHPVTQWYQTRDRKLDEKNASHAVVDTGAKFNASLIDLKKSSTTLDERLSMRCCGLPEN